MLNTIKKIFKKEEATNKKLTAMDEFLLVCGDDITIINMEALELWINYKWQLHNVKYKTKRPMNDMVKAGDFDQQMALVKGSIKKGYAGLFPPKKAGAKKWKDEGATKAQYDYMYTLNQQKHEESPPCKTKKEAANEIARLLSLPNYTEKKPQTPKERKEKARLMIVSFMSLNELSVLAAMEVAKEKLTTPPTPNVATKIGTLMANKKGYSISALALAVGVNNIDFASTLYENEKLAIRFMKWLPVNPYSTN